MYILYYVLFFLSFYFVIDLLCGYILDGIFILFYFPHCKIINCIYLTFYRFLYFYNLSYYYVDYLIVFFLYISNLSI